MAAQPQPTRTYDFAGGTNAVADQVDTDLNTLYTVLQGGIGDTHIASDAAISLSKLASVAWETFTPTWTASSSNPAIGNGTLTGRYIKIGRLYHCVVRMLAGSTTTFGSGVWRFALPATAANQTARYTRHVGYARDESATTEYFVYGDINANGTFIEMDTINVTSTYPTNTSVTATVPFTWANTDFIAFSYWFESAA